MAIGTTNSVPTLTSSVPDNVVLFEESEMEEFEPVPLDADTLEGHSADEFAKKFESCETVFNDDGSITQTTKDGVLNTVFNDDGSITEIYTSSNGKTVTKITIFNEDGSISEEVE